VAVRADLLVRAEHLPLAGQVLGGDQGPVAGRAAGPGVPDRGDPVRRYVVQDDLGVRMQQRDDGLADRRVRADPRRRLVASHEYGLYVQIRRIV
jgi:hypothetical protein